MLILEEKFRRHLEAFASELWDTIYIYIVYQIINISLVSKLKKNVKPVEILLPRCP